MSLQGFEASQHIESKNLKQKQRQDRVSSIATIGVFFQVFGIEYMFQFVITNAMLQFEIALLAKHLQILDAQCCTFTYAGPKGRHLFPHDPIAEQAVQEVVIAFARWQDNPHQRICKESSATEIKTQ